MVFSGDINSKLSTCQWHLGEPCLFVCLFVYLRQRERQRQRHREREKQAPRREPDVRLDLESTGSRPGLKAALNR